MSELASPPRPPSTVSAGLKRFVWAVAGVATVLAVVVATIGAVAGYRVVRPRQAAVADHDIDALVVLAGGRGERGRTALSVAESGPIPVVVVNVGNRDWGPGWDVVAPLCPDPAPRPDEHPYEVICTTVHPDNTAGEASTISALARQRGWDTIALVTSDYHLHRATTRFERCFDGTIVPVAATSTVSRGVFVYEWFGTMHAILIDRGC